MLLLCLFPSACAGFKGGNSEYNTGIIEETDSYVNDIEKSSESEYRKLKKDIYLSSQGGELVFYLDDNYGETGKKTENFYLEDENNIMFLCDSTFYYSESIYDPQNVIDSIEVNRYYLDDNKLNLMAAK